MRPKENVLIALLIIIALAGCKTVLQADFDADTIGAHPAASPPDRPPDDLLKFQGSSGSITVILSETFNSQAVKLNRTSAPPATVLEGLPGDGPLDKGRFQIEYRAYYEEDQAALFASLWSKSGHQAFILSLADGRYRLTSGRGTEDLPSIYHPFREHKIRIEVDLENRHFMVFTKDLEIRRPFMEAQFDDLYLLRFAYVEAIVEAFPGIYVIDDLKIEKKTWWPF